VRDDHLMRIFFLLLALCARLQASEDLLVNQAGISIPAGTWTNITSTVGGLPGTKFMFYVTGWDKAFYVPAIDRFCQLASAFQPSSEPNQNWYCYSFTEHRWDLWDMAGSFHNEHLPEGGHPVGFVNVDPTTSVALGPCCFSGSQVGEEIKWGMWKYDFLAQVGIPQVTFGGLEQDNQLGTATYDPFDQLLIGFGGSQSNGGQGHVQYDNNPAHTACTTAGSNCYNSWTLAPSSVTLNGLNPNIEFNAMAMNNADRKVYLFGGFYSGVAHNGVWTYNTATTTWTNIFADATTSAFCHDSSSGNNCPAGRNEASFAYDDHANVFLMHGGCTIINISGCTGAQLLTDTWIFDPVAVTWQQLNPGSVPAYTTGIVANERLVYMKEDDVFLLSTEPSTTVALYAFRLAPGGNAGYRTKSYNYSPSGLNVYTTSNIAESWAYGTTISAASGAVYNVWTETNNKYQPTPPNSWLLHPYAQQNVSGTVTMMPAPFTNSTSYAAMSPDVGSTPRQAFDISSAVINGVPWSCWHEQNPGLQEFQNCKGFSGGVWGGTGFGGLVPFVASQYQGPAQIIGVGTTPTIITREQNRLTGNIPYPEYCYVEQWIGSAWTVVGGGALNSGFSICDGASIATDGTNIWASFVLYGSFTSAAAGSNGVFIGPPQVQLWKWSGSTWAQQGGTGNVLSNSGCTGMLTGNPPTYVGTSCSRAFNTSVTVLGGIPYVAFVERADQGIIQKLWVRSYNSGWASVGSFLNKDKNDGWAFRPEITNDGSNLFITWSEQGNPQSWIGTSASPANSHASQKPHVYAAQLTTGGALTYLGGALNADTLNGSATHPAVAMMATGQPVVEWGEVNNGQLRQAYVKQWNGTDWGAVGAGNLTITTNSLGAGTIGGTYSQALAASGGTQPYVNWAIASGSLPAGISLNASTGMISGTVTGAPGTSTFSVRVSDSAASPATANSEPLSLTINAAPDIATVFTSLAER
jgi:hypothetical protein